MESVQWPATRGCTMATTPSDSQRIVMVTAANIRQSHIYLNGHVDFFPKDAIGSSSKKSGQGQPIELDVKGLGGPVMTDLPVHAKTGRARGFFRGRAWVKQFF